MADLGFLSETDDSAVESIIAEAMDHCVLEQVSSINLTGTTLLPPDLEARFGRLKTFPGPNPKTKSFPDENIEPQTHKNEFETSIEDPNFKEKHLSPIPKYGYLSSPSNSSDSTLEPPTPPRKTCCFWVSPKSGSKKRSKESRIGEFDWGKKNDGGLSDLTALSVKEQGRKLKKAMKEEEKVTREAEKIVEWAKQASARMDEFVIHDVVSSDDDMFR